MGASLAALGFVRRVDAEPVGPPPPIVLTNFRLIAPSAVDKALRSTEVAVHSAAILLSRADSLAACSCPTIHPFCASSGNVGSSGTPPRAHVGIGITLLAQYQNQAATPPAPNPTSASATLANLIFRPDAPPQ
jgi:hypothetical protein